MQSCCFIIALYAASKLQKLYFNLRFNLSIYQTTFFFAFDYWIVLPGLVLCSPEKRIDLCWYEIVYDENRIIRYKLKEKQTWQSLPDINTRVFHHKMLWTILHFFDSIVFNIFLKQKRHQFPYSLLLEYSSSCSIKQLFNFSGTNFNWLLEPVANFEALGSLLFFSSVLYVLLLASWSFFLVLEFFSAAFFPVYLLGLNEVLPPLTGTLDAFSYHSKVCCSDCLALISDVSFADFIELLVFSAPEWICQFRLFSMSVDDSISIISSSP